MSKYRQIYNGEWEAVGSVYKIRCCDCKLVHLVHTRKRKGKLEWRWFVDKRATGQARRHNHKAQEQA